MSVGKRGRERRKLTRTRAHLFLLASDLITPLSFLSSPSPLLSSPLSGLAEEGALEARLQADLDAAQAEQAALPAKVAELEVRGWSKPRGGKRLSRRPVIVLTFPAIMSFSSLSHQAALAAEADAHASKEASISASSRARGAQYAAVRVAPAFYAARLGLAVEHGAMPGGGTSRARPGEVLYVFTLLDCEDPGREGLLGIRSLPRARAAAPGAGGGGGGGSGGPSTSAPVPSEKAVAVTRCEPALPAVLPALLARLADPSDAFGMRELVIGVRAGFVEAFAAEKKMRGGAGRGR